MADGRTRDITSDEVSSPGVPRADVSRGTSAYADWTPIAEEAARAARVLHPDKHRMPRPQQRRVLTVANQKGGVGKTTSTVNVAAALAMHGVRVLVVDLDPQGNASTALDVEHRSGTPSVYELLLGEIPLGEAATQSSASENLWCVPATIDLAGAEIELVAAEEVLIPIQCEYYALEGLGQLLSNIDLVRSHLNRDLHVSTILLTMYDGRTKLADQVTNEVRKHFGDTVLRTVIPRSVKVSEAPGFGQTVLGYDPGSRGALSYLDAAREIALQPDDPGYDYRDDPCPGTREVRS